MLDNRSCTRSFSSREIKAWLQTWTRDSKPRSLFQALGQWGWSWKRARDERDLVKKKIGEDALSYLFTRSRSVPFVPRRLFWSSPLTVSLEQARTQVVCIIPLATVQIYGLSYIHLYCSRVYYELTKWPAPRWLYSSVGRALQRYRSHGFAPRAGLTFFRL